MNWKKATMKQLRNIAFQDDDAPWVHRIAAAAELRNRYQRNRYSRVQHKRKEMYPR